jgi:arylsulfatase A-like enzyme
VYVGGLWLPLCATLIGTKLHKASVLGASGGLDAAAALGGDLVFLAVLFAAGFFGLGPPRLRSATLAATHVLSPLLVILLVMEHLFFLVGGAVPDWYVLKDAIVRFATLHKLLGNEVTPARLALLFTPVAWSGAVYFVGRWYRRRRKAERVSSQGPRVAHVVAGACVAMALLGVVGLALPGAEAARPLRGNVYTQFAWDFVADALTTSEFDADLLGDAGADAPRGPTSLVATKVAGKNLVFITLESTGARHTGLYGSPHPITPFLDRLAGKGAVVETAYTVFPHTSKALVGIHCGVHPRPAPGVSEAAASGMPVSCLPKLLREQGVATAFFQTAEENYERRSSLAGELGFGHFAGKESIPAEGFEESNYFGWEDDAMLAPILSWVDGQTGRFYLSVLTLTSHHPYVVPESFPTEQYVQNRALNDYLNTIRYSDRFVGRLYEAFEERGLTRDTIFFIIGDHGEAFGEHGRSQHTPVPYDEVLHVPLLIVGPGVSPGTRVTGLRQAVDLAPTAARLMGFEPRGGDFFGSDLLEGPAHERLFFHCGYHEYCMGFVWPDYKLIYHFDRRRPQVYDLRVDPLEKNDLYASPTPALRSRMERALARLRNMRAVTNAAYQRQAKRRVPHFVHTTLPNQIGTPMEVNIGDFVRIVGFSVDPPEIEGGGRSVITTWYEVLKDPPEGWVTFHHLLGTSFKNADHVPVEGAYPVARWEAGDIIEDRHILTTRPDAETGRWEIATGMWRRLADGRSERASVTVVSGPATVRSGELVVLGTLEITADRLDPAIYVTQTPPPAATPPVTIRFGEDFGLVSAGVERPSSKGGLKVTQEYGWQVLNKPAPGEYRFVVEVEGARGKRLVHHPLGGAWPVSEWEPGQYIRDRQAIITKTTDPPGAYRVWLSVQRDDELLPVSGDGLKHRDGRVLVGEYQLVQ